MAIIKAPSQRRRTVGAEQAAEDEVRGLRAIRPSRRPRQGVSFPETLMPGRR